MSYEINIIAINQKRPVHIAHSSEILLLNELENLGVSRYAEIWPFFSNTPGVLYSLVTKINEGYYSARKICDSDFNVICEDKLFEWVSKDNKENLTPFIVENKFYNEFATILCYLLENAPQKRILFQTRYQGGDKEIILGVIKISKFMNMLSSRKIFFNICYILEADK